MNSDNDNPPRAEMVSEAASEAQENLIDGAALEVTIHFELEKKLLPFYELESLCPGKTFRLGVEPLSPVTLTLNGQALARGRLVDLNGALGVQITRLTGTPRHD